MYLYHCVSQSNWETQLLNNKGLSSLVSCVLFLSLLACLLVLLQACTLPLSDPVHTKSTLRMSSCQPVNGTKHANHVSKPCIKGIAKVCCFLSAKDTKIQRLKTNRCWCCCSTTETLCGCSWMIWKQSISKRTMAEGQIFNVYFPSI